MCIPVFGLYGFILNVDPHPVNRIIQEIYRLLSAAFHAAQDA